VCGINGIYGIEECKIAQQKVEAMNHALRHRGPNDEGVFIAEKIALGHRRLSIIDLSSSGHQPMKSFNGRYQIVYNGELYNYKELRLELSRVVSGSGSSTYFFQTQTDTEVIIAAYARWGVDCMNHFNGMFAFAIWDTEKSELFITRDRLGIKPLYYSFVNDVFLFSSEVRALLASKMIPRKIDENSLVDYFRYQTVHAPNTIVKGVKMLMPGYYIKASNKKVTTHKYWNLTENLSHDSEGKSYMEVCRDVNNLLTKSVEMRMIADVPFGAFLSGGIDSTAIVGLMNKVSSEKVKTFSITFDESTYSEASYAQMVAKKFSTDHHEIRLKPKDFLHELPESLKSMDHPTGDGVNTYVVSKATKNAGITMALSGLGGDELFGGYDVFKRAIEINNKRWMNYCPLLLRKLVGNTLKSIRPGISSDKIAEFIRRPDLNFNSFYTLSRQVLLDNQIKGILKIDSLPANMFSEIIEQPSLYHLSSQISQVSIAEISTYMQNVLLRDSDQMSMAHALEVRVPFIDYKLVEYVLGIKDDYKSLESPKKLLVDSLGELLPKEIVNRKKMGFSFPWEVWLKNEIKDFCEDRIVSLSKRELMNQKGVLNLWNSFLKGNPHVTWSRVWHLVVLENWLLENNIEV